MNVRPFEGRTVVVGTATSEAGAAADLDPDADRAGHRRHPGHDQQRLPRRPHLGGQLRGQRAGGAERLAVELPVLVLHQPLARHGVQVDGRAPQRLGALLRIALQQRLELAVRALGKDKVFGFLMGQVMKSTKGKGNPQLLNDILRKKLAG